MKDRFEAVDAVVRDACGTAFTAAVARIERGGALCFERAYGVTRADAEGRPVFLDTRFDLASLTKLFVATLVLRAVAEKRLGLDEIVVPPSITARMLLAHDSGMNSGADYRLLLDHNVETFALEEPLVATPGERVIYSDLGFIVIGVLLERLDGCALSSIVERFFARPTLGFRPAAAERRSIPATEDDGWRGRVQGSVHDEKAHLMGGVAGHAGLFGTAADVAALTEGYLGSLCGRDRVLRRGLGWALKTNDANSCGRFFSSTSFGHTGFVGTCVWADPERDLQGVLLTNSVYFGRNDIRDLRAAFYEAAAEATAR